MSGWILRFDRLGPALSAVLGEMLVHGFKVLLAKNNCDNLPEEVQKGMTEKAIQGHWPF